MAGKDKQFEQSGTDAGGQAAEFVDTPMNEPGNHDEPPAPTNRTIDRQTETVDLPGMGVIAQENVGPASEGSGEFPSPKTPPRGPSPG